MKFTFTSLLLISALTFTFAKEEKAKEPEIVKEDAAASGKDEAVAEPLTDGSGAKTEGGSSDFDIEQLLKLIDALKNQDFDEVDRTLKDSKDHGFDFHKMDHLPEEKIEESGKKEEEKKEDDKKEAAPKLTDTEEELEKMEL